VIHTHDIAVVEELNLSQANTVLILSCRHDVFAQAMSLLISRMTNEWSGKDYTNKPVAAWSVDAKEFINLCSGYHRWYDAVGRMERYKKIVSIYYEDIVDHDRAQFIADQVGVEYCATAVGTIQQKSLRQYQDYISNWAELKNLYHTVYTNK
jgi:hypothetical protein